MSGLTPILDTLLHHVLGKRGDAQRPSALRPDRIVNEVAAVSSSKSAAEDPRLPARGPEAGRRGGVVDTAPGRAADARAPLSTATEPAGTQARPPAEGATGRDASLRLSAPGQFITHLQRGTAKGLVPTVRPPGFLVDATLPQALAADGVAQRLAGGIRESGLFYENHLAQWHRGGKSADELSREPQMRIWQRARAAGGSDGPTAGTALDRGTSAGVTVSLPGDHARAEVDLYAPAATRERPANSAGGVSAVGGRVDSKPPDARPEQAEKSPPGAIDDRRQLSVESQERLQTIVRNQLELFGAPALRWEGEVDDGFLMFMEISLPEEHRPGENDSERSSSSKRKGDGDWATTIELELPLLGDVTVALRRTADRLSVELCADRAETAVLMNVRRTEIVERLVSRGVPSPGVRVEGASHDAGGRTDERP